MKVCSFCKKELHASDYYKDSRQADGLKSQCKKCHRITSNHWAKINPDKLKAACNKYYQKNKRDVINKSISWQKRNRAAFRVIKNAASAKRRAAKLHATPIWADRRNTIDMYKLAKMKSASTGIKHHVDHIFPIKSSIVCGLHVAANLRVITAEDNIRKGNSFPYEYA